MNETTVVRIRRKGGVVVQDCDVYIGRAMTQGGWSLATSKWANPFKVSDIMPRKIAVESYRKLIIERVHADPKYIDELHSLRGKRLGCWCAPEACHGDVLKELSAMTREELLAL